ncbi:MAG: hypothetical protein WCF10_01345, partial [Polyangiales bacterium]
MRYLVSVASVLAGLVALPLSGSAQAENEGTSAEPGAEKPVQSTETHRSWLERSHPEAFVDPTKPASEPALQLEVDSAGLQVTPTAPLAPEELRLQEMALRVRRAKLGVGVSVIPTVVGALIATVSAVSSISSIGSTNNTSSSDAALYAGSAIVAVGGASMIATGILLGVRKHQLREFKETQHGTARRLQWD